MLLKTTSKKLVHKATEATCEFIRNKIADKIAKPKLVFDENPRNVEEIFIPPEKRKNIERIKTSFIKMEHHKISKLPNDPTLSNFVKRK